MKASMYHRILEQRREAAVESGVSGIYNGIVVENPVDAIDCTPDTGFASFQHAVMGDRLVYCELANSTPFSGHTVCSEFKPLVRKNARTSCVFSQRDIDHMRRKVVGVKVLSQHRGYFPLPEDAIGEVVDASAVTWLFHGEKYKTLCILCWIDGGMVEKRMSSNLLYLSFGVRISNEICCKCGKSSSVSTPCRHIRDNTASSSLSICVFDRFNSIELSRTDFE